MSDQFNQRRLGPQDVAAGTRVCIWDGQGFAPLDRGVVIAYVDQPTVTIRHDDGTTDCWSTSLPWHEIIDPRGPVNASAYDLARNLNTVEGVDSAKYHTAAHDLVKTLGLDPL